MSNVNSVCVVRRVYIYLTIIHVYTLCTMVGIQAYEDHYYQYIECDKEGYMSEYALCREKKVYMYVFMYDCII